MIRDETTALRLPENPGFNQPPPASRGLSPWI